MSTRYASLYETPAVVEAHGAAVAQSARERLTSEWIPSEGFDDVERAKPGTAWEIFDVLRCPVREPN